MSDFLTKAQREQFRYEEQYSEENVLKLLAQIDALEKDAERRLMVDDGFRAVFHLQRKSIGPEWENQTPGHSRKDDALACAKFCKQTSDRPLRVIEVRTRVVADPVAVDDFLHSFTEEPK